jgi:hypothetical protein
MHALPVFFGGGNMDIGVWNTELKSSRVCTRCDDGMGGRAEIQDEVALEEMREVSEDWVTCVFFLLSIEHALLPVRISSTV